MILVLRWIGWLAFTAVMAVAFLVVLDYGPERFPEGMEREWRRLNASVQSRLKVRRIKAAQREQAVTATNQRPGTVESGGGSGN